MILMKNYFLDFTYMILMKVIFRLYDTDENYFFELHSYDTNEKLFFGLCFTYMTLMKLSFGLYFPKKF